MDNLSDLPPIRDVKPTRDENDVMSRYFLDDKRPPGLGDSNSSSFLTSVKVAFYLTIIFVMICNPLTDSICKSFTFCQSPFVLFAVKMLAFFILSILILLLS